MTSSTLGASGQLSVCACVRERERKRRQCEEGLARWQVNEATCRPRDLHTSWYEKQELLTCR
eukprot:6181384-Pleurochrysis_carterae.AAC.1